MKSNRTLLLIGAGIVGFGYLLIALPPWQVDQVISHEPYEKLAANPAATKIDSEEAPPP